MREASNFKKKMVDGEKIEVSIDGKKMIRVRDSEIQKGKIALITQQRLPLTVIDDFLVRPIQKKGMFTKKQNGKESQAKAQSEITLNSSSNFIPSTPAENSYTYKEQGKGPNTDSELFSPFSPISHFSPEPDPIYQTTSSLPPSELLLYYHHDHLGNIRVVTDQNRNVVERHDFYPFGEEITTQPQNTDQYLFTGKPRDSETGLDYFGARYYSSSLSRFLSVDPGKPNPKILQTWNKYTYCLNNPVKYIDLSGKYFVVPYNDPNRGKILRALALGALTPSGSKVFSQIQTDPRSVILKSGEFTPLSKFDPKTKTITTDITFGRMTGFKRNGLNLSGLEYSFDWKNISKESKKGLVDPQGIRTMYHELFHIGAGLEGKDFTSAVANMAAGDKPSSEKGPARKFGEQVFAEYQYLSEFFEASSASHIMDYLVENTIKEIEQKQQQMITEIVLNAFRALLIF